MSDLLQIGASGVRAFNTAMATIGENVSNASTEGYARRIVAFEEAPASRDASTGNINGVRTASITRAWDSYRATANRDAQSTAASASTYSTWMGKVEGALSDDAAGIGQTATTIFTTSDALAANPNDTSSRKAFLAAIDATATAFNTTAQSLANASDDVAAAATTTVEAINATLDSLDNINASLHAVQAGTAAQANLLDQRDKVLDGLSKQLGIDVSYADDGSATVQVAGGGVTLANSGGTAARLSLMTGTGSNSGRITVTAINTRDETPISLTGGSLGGLVQAADMVAQRRVALDTLAQSFASQLNTWSAQGKDMNGDAGGDLISGTTAATLKAAVTDTAKVPAATAGTAGTANGNLLTLSALRGDSGVEKKWAAMVSDHGRQTATAETASTAAATRAEATASALNDVTAVDLDTEAADLIRYQQAYAGAAKVIQAARDTMQALLNVI